MVDQYAGMADNVPENYVWRPKTNNSFSGQCHIETGGTWLRFEFDSRLGRIERPQEKGGNPLLIVTDGGARVALRGAVTIVAPDTQGMGTVTFTPQDEGITEWHWTHTRDGETYTEVGSGTFLRDEPKLEPLSRPTQIAPTKKTGAKKVAVKTTVRKKTVKKAAKKAVAKKAPAKKAPAKKAKKTAMKKAAPAKKAKAVKKARKGGRRR